MGQKERAVYYHPRERHIIHPDSCTALKYDFKIAVGPLCHLQRLPFVIRRVVNDSQLPSRCILLMLCHILKTNSFDSRNRFSIEVLSSSEFVLQKLFINILYWQLSFRTKIERLLRTFFFLSAWPDFELIFMFFGWKYLSFNLLVYFVVIHVINETLKTFFKSSERQQSQPAVL